MRTCTKNDAPFGLSQPLPPVRSDRRGYRIPEAAQYMGVASWFVEVKLRSGELFGLKLCRHWTVLREDMDRFLDAQREKEIERRAVEREAA
jgi:excisionase family DNA binding protein